jgi:hypothetical protein
MTKNICGGGKYILGGPNEDAIGLPVSISHLPETIEVEGYTLLRKSTFHSTLICIGKIIEINKIEIPDFKKKVLADFCDFIQNNSIDIINFRDEFRFANEDEKRAVVVMCDISNLNKFFDLISEKYNLDLEYPPTHVTLYTLQPDKGVFLTGTEDIKTMAKPITNPGIKLKWRKL